MQFDISFKPSFDGPLWKKVDFKFTLKLDKWFSYTQLDWNRKQVFGHTWLHYCKIDGKIKSVLPEWHETSLLSRLARTVLGEKFSDTSTRKDYERMG